MRKDQRTNGERRCNSSLQVLRELSVQTWFQGPDGNDKAAGIVSHKGNGSTEVGGGLAPYGEVAHP